MGCSYSSSSFSYFSSDLIFNSSNSSNSVIEVLSYLLGNRVDESWTMTIKNKLRKEMDKNSHLKEQIEKKIWCIL